MGTTLLIVTWLLSVLGATVIGYEKGRPEHGVGLGILLGPVGLLVIGFLAPSLRVAVRRQYELDQQMALLRKADAKKAQEKKQVAVAIDLFVQALQEQMEHSAAPTFADGLNGLAEELERLAQRDPKAENSLRPWIGWLNQQSDAVRGLAAPPK